MTIRVFLADDQGLVRGGFRMLIEAEDDMDVVGEAADGAAAVRELQRITADVVLMDIRMPNLDGVQATAQLTRANNPAKVLILTTFDLDEYVYAGLQAGASGFLLKDARPVELLAAIRNVAAGDAVVAPSATKRLLDKVLPTLQTDGAARTDDRLDTLTPREIDVLKEIAAGATNTEIAGSLFMAEGTVKTHIGRLLAKLQCRDRVSLVLLAYETGLVQR